MNIQNKNPNDLKKFNTFEICATQFHTWLVFHVSYVQSGGRSCKGTAKVTELNLGLARFPADSQVFVSKFNLRIAESGLVLYPPMRSKADMPYQAGIETMRPPNTSSPISGPNLHTKKVQCHGIQLKVVVLPKLLIPLDLGETT